MIWMSRKLGAIVVTLVPMEPLITTKRNQVDAPLDNKRLDPKRRIFLIGFNKCGSTSFHNLMQLSGIPSLHWGGANPKTNLACVLARNLSLRLPILKGIDDFWAFSDFTYVTQELVLEGNIFFKELAAAYPESYFIFNTRPVSDWIASREHHNRRGRKISLMSRMSAALDLSPNEIREIWKHQFEDHAEKVRSFFMQQSTPFLELELGPLFGRQVSNFLSPHFKVEADHYSHINKTVTSRRWF